MKKDQFALYGFLVYICTYKINVMDTKLTLKLDKFVIEKAKEYAASHKRSLSRLIESYLKSLVILDSPESKDEIQISPFVKSLSTGVNIPDDYDHKKEYTNYLSKKYN